MRKTTLDPPAYRELQPLLDFEGTPAVSVYLPLHGHGREGAADRLRLRAALERARDALAERYRVEVWKPMLEGLEPLTRGGELWGKRSGGLALYLAPGFRRAYTIPLELPETVVVASTFHTRPLVDYLASPQRFYVLELSQKRVELWEGGPDGLQPADRGLLPRSLTDALGFEFERDEKVVLRRKERDGAHGEHGRGGIMPVFHGHGVGLDDREPELEAFFREVDEALRVFLRGRHLPVILATVKENEAVYRSISGLDNLAEEAVVANVRYWSPEELHAAAWSVAEREAERRVEAALEVWESARSREAGEADLANLSHLAVAGRVRLLLTERGRRIWGTLERATGRLEVIAEGGADPGPEAVDLLDELGEVVIRHGGDVLPLARDRMPTTTGAAGVLR